MKNQGIDIGLEAMLEPTLDTAVVYDAEVALDMMESAMLLEADVAELDGMLKFEANVSGIAASVKENGIDAGTEALVGSAMSSYFAKWDADDATGTAEVMEAGLETISEKVTEAIRKIVERIRQFFVKLMLNEAGVRKEYNAQRLRIASMKNFVWKKDEKKFKTPGGVHKGKALGAVSVAFLVVEELSKNEFNISKGKVSDEFMDGTLIKEFRSNAKDTKEFDCSKAKPDTIANIYLKEISDNLDAVNKNTNAAKNIRSIKTKKIEEATGNLVNPARAASSAASILTWMNLHYLKIARSHLAILKNIK